MNVFQKYLHIISLEFLKKIKPEGFTYSIQGPKFGRSKWITDSKTNNELLLGIYEEDLFKVLVEKLSKGKVFYDLGAHWGYFSILASKIVGNEGYVYGFEPMPQNFDRFSRNVEANGISNVSCCQMAVSDKKGKVNFSNSDDSYANTYIENDQTSSIEVETNSIDELMSTGFRPPDFIKIDVEGAELDVLHGSANTIQTFRPVIHLSTHEIHLKGVDENCSKFIKELGYDLNLISSKKGIKDYICTSK